MTNYEKYREKILDVVVSRRCFAVVDGELVLCGDVMCEQCDLYQEGKSCVGILRDWLNAEYVEPLKLTKAERAFCESLVPGCYIARDSSGDLYIYIGKPVKGRMVWGTPDEMCEHWSHLGAIFNVSFPFVKWEDEKPWKVEDLLKLEVLDETGQC